MRHGVPALFLCFVLAHAGAVLAYGTHTHRLLSYRGLDVSSADLVMRRELGFAKGVRSAFLSETPRAWTANGSVSEDTPDDRVRFHFHDPLAPLSGAGLFGGAHQSSVLWGQNPNQFTLTGTWSWPRARRSYLDALTAETLAERERHFADLFRALGQLVHLIQDAAVPAHVRADPHLIVVDPDPYEAWAERTAEWGLSAFPTLVAHPVVPPASIFTPGPEQAPIPIARLIDSDRLSGGDATLLTEPDIGIAEYTNGNFLSKDTIFSRYELPSPAGFAPEFRELFEPVQWADGIRYRRYFQKSSQGETIPRFVADSMLYETILEETGAPLRGSWTLTEGVHQDYAARLLPRAVGSSAALIDYFFRGTLDAHVEVADPEGDPTLLRLVGRNGSDEVMANGTLTILAEKLSLDRERAPVDLVPFPADPNRPGVVEIVRVEPQGALPVIQFRAPFPDVARYVIVYRGDLGHERAGHPDSFLGAVVGKVVGGVQAQAIVADGDARRLRTAAGVFPLPAAVGPLEAVQWGDRDNSFIGAVLGEGGDPETIKAFEIARAEGIADVPLQAAPDGTDVVAVGALTVSPFPFGLPLGTTVHFTHSVRYIQNLLTFDRVSSGTRHPDPDGSDTCLTVTEVGPMRRESAVDEPVVFTEHFPIVLDRAHLASGSSPRPYAWRVVEVGLDAQRRPLAAVEVVLTQPTEVARSVPIRARDDTGQLVPVGETAVSPQFPIRRLLRAVIDVEGGTVLGTTAASDVSLSITQADGAAHVLIQEHLVFTGCAAGTEQWRTVPLLSQPSSDAMSTTTGTVSFPPSEQSLVIEGWYRQDLEPLIATAVHFWPRSTDTVRYYAVVDRDGTPVYHAARWSTTSVARSGYLTTLDQGLRMRPASGTAAEYLLLFTRPVGVRDEGEEGVLVRWSPEDPARTGLAYGRPLPPAEYRLEAATPEAALLAAVDPTARPFSMLIDLVSGQSTTYPGRDLGAEYALLAPIHLYNIGDTHFHTNGPDLSETAIPPALAPGPPAPAAAYGLIQLP
jgi:hypothetical protein